MNRLVELRFEQTGNGYFVRTSLSDQSLTEVFEQLETPMNGYDDRDWMENDLIEVAEDAGLVEFIELDEAEADEQYDRYQAVIQR